MDLQVIAEAREAGRPLTEWQQQAWGNRRMLTSRDDAIHVGDIVLVPHMPGNRRFSLVRVVGPYEYDGGQAFERLRAHPARTAANGATSGHRLTDPSVPIKLQTSLGNRVRLWNLDAFGADLVTLAAKS